MLADVSLHAEADRRLRFVLKADHIERAVEDGDRTPKLETGSGREFEKGENVWRDHHACTKAERCPVRGQSKRISDGCRREKVGGTRVETPLSVCVQVNGGRKEEINSLTDPHRQAGLKIVGIFFRKVAVSLHTRVALKSD